MEEKIIPIHADAHELPFANEYFDVVVSIDSYHYYGCEPDYLSKHVILLVKKSGKIFIGIPGLQKEFSNGIPEELGSTGMSGVNFYDFTEYFAD